MPRPRQAHGRPGTRVVPRGFETEHARVFEGTRTAACRIYAPTTGEPVFDPDLGYSVPPTAALLHEGTVRLQSIAGDRNVVVGDQDQGTSSYRAAIAWNAPVIPAGSTLVVSESTDTWFDARVLFVRNGDLGTVRFERHLYAVDDVSDTTSDEPEEDTP